MAGRPVVVRPDGQSPEARCWCGLTANRCETFGSAEFEQVENQDRPNLVSLSKTLAIAGLTANRCESSNSKDFSTTTLQKQLPPL